MMMVGLVASQREVVTVTGVVIEVVSVVGTGVVSAAEIEVVSAVEIEVVSAVGTEVAVVEIEVAAGAIEAASVEETVVVIEVAVGAIEVAAVTTEEALVGSMDAIQMRAEWPPRVLSSHSRERE